MLVPEKLTNYNVYKQNGTRFLGLAAETTLPTMEQLSEEVSGAGIAGGFDSPTPGHFGPITSELTFRQLSADAFEILSEDSYSFTLRAAQQAYDTAAGVVRQRGLKVTLRGRPKSVDLGKVAIGATSDTKVTVSLTYIKIEENGRVLLEYDKFNMIYIVNGIDKMSEIRKLI